MVRKTEVVYKEDVRGGKGKIEFRHICPKEELLGHAAMFAHLILEPHASIGTHQHVHNTEPYYILKGNGVFVDNDGSRTEIHAGDVCTIEVGQSHSLENTSDEPMELIALVVNEKGLMTE